jgi:hypothetical protein
MTYSTTENPDVVLCNDTGMWVSRGTRQWDEYEAWLAQGNAPEPYAPFPPHSPQHYAFIRGRRYDSIESCCSYATSSVARYRAEAEAMVAWRDEVNLALEAMVANPPPGVETWEQVKAVLPQPEEYSWPAAVDLPLDVLPPVHLE